MKVYIRGGVGDFIQCIPFLSKNLHKEYLIHTHFKGAEQFFNKLGAKKLNICFFENLELYNQQMKELPQGMIECPRETYSKLEFKKDIKDEAEKLIFSFENKKKIIGIHPFGSDFSTGVYFKSNLPIKFVPKGIINELVKEDFNYLLFGSKGELESLRMEERNNLKFVNFESILTSLCCVLYCDKLIGTDSCFKTMSSVHKIPTFCIVGDFKDPIRDKTFINPYVKDGVMTILKYKSLGKDSERIVSFFKESMLK